MCTEEKELQDLMSLSNFDDPDEANTGADDVMLIVDGLTLVLQAPICLAEF